MGIMNFHLNGCDIVRLAQRFGLPLHLYDAQTISGNLHAFQSTFEETGISGGVCYAVKACGFPEIIRLAVRTGAGADVASEYELATALAAGIPPEKLVMHGNAKSDAYLKKAVALGALIAANHHTELDRINAEAKKQRKTSPGLAPFVRLSIWERSRPRGFLPPGLGVSSGNRWPRFRPCLKALRQWPHYRPE